jgi:hypothetical protein
MSSDGAKLLASAHFIPKLLFNTLNGENWRRKLLGYDERGMQDGQQVVHDLLRCVIRNEGLRQKSYKPQNIAIAHKIFM